jgi:AcrR family transcriptional regulator
LIQAVLARRLEPLNRARLDALDACEAAAGDRPVPLEKLLGAFLNPVIAMGGHGPPVMRLIGIMYSEPSVDVQSIFSAELGPTVQRFFRAFSRTLPGLPPEELFWRVFFTIGALAQTLAAGSLLRFLSGGRCDPLDFEDAGKRLIRYSAAGLRAAAAARGGKRRGIGRG